VDGGSQSQPAAAVDTPRRDALLSASANQQMFGSIVNRYDVLNRTLSLGQDSRWRRLAVQALGPVDTGRYLDVGTGTADLIQELLLQAPEASVLGVDLVVPMLVEGRRKLDLRATIGSRVALLAADGLRLPFRAASFDGGCSAFVIRNVEDRSRLFAEVYRVLRLVLDSLKNWIIGDQ
jgi:demethylmenaquinone methyltransferase/2-methoxy-6-polyprenyl-1,4-benzoquinol methylase